MPDIELLRVCADFELGLRLPETECPHGRHVGDTWSPPCGCYPSEAVKEEERAA